ncbi:MAG: PQQ-dependent sugar dehydrogenase [Chloroflexota bacterium]|nr:PQQ-dependent sugar dehydrogenase [Chloroflexota bacterium]
MDPTSTADSTATATATPTPTLPGTPTPTASAPPVELVLEPFADGLDALTFITHAGDGSGRLYALEQAGRIRIIGGDGTVHEAPFLDISDRVRAGGELGLLGLAFHPRYAENGRLFVNYTDTAGDTVVSEFARATETAAEPASERVILAFDQPFTNHNGGWVAFGPDGMLYISTGDGGGAGDPLGAGQDTTTLLAKMLRIDVDSATDTRYAIPADNPFTGQDGVRPEIWAFGLRNPWRASFDRQTGDLFIGDVGQRTWEEISVAPAGTGGQNYGWNVMEGPECFRSAECDTSGLTPPVAWYPTRADGGCAITGGYVYRGQALPGFGGTYFFADYCSGILWSLDAAAALAGGQTEPRELMATDLSISSFGEDEQGELYAVDHGGRIVRFSGRQASLPR